jgi:hypothetical protein
MLDLKEEAKFAELKDKCRDLRVPTPPEIFIGLKVHDKDGILTFDDIQRGHSWNRNLWNILFMTCCDCAADGSTFGAGTMGTKSQDGTSRGNTTSSYARGVSGGAVGNYIAVSYGWCGAAGVAAGIVIGTSDTAFSPQDYALGALISPGGWVYNAMGIGSIAYTAGTKTWKHTKARVFNNNTGGSVTVKETGLTGYATTVNGLNPVLYLFERSVLSPTVAVPNGAQLTVTYEISMDFSAID